MEISGRSHETSHTHNTSATNAGSCCSFGVFGFFNSSCSHADTSAYTSSHPTERKMERVEEERMAKIYSGKGGEKFKGVGVADERAIEGKRVGETKRYC